MDLAPSYGRGESEGKPSANVLEFSRTRSWMTDDLDGMWGRVLYPKLIFISCYRPITLPVVKFSEKLDTPLAKIGY